MLYRSQAATQTLETATIEDRNGNRIDIKVGQVVGFKSDFEQYGTIIEIRRTRYGYKLLLGNEYGFEGDYIEGERETIVDGDEIWID